VDGTQGGATRAEIDAFKLLNAFVQNSDNKATQNTLACPRAALDVGNEGGVPCRGPIMFVDDLGSVFGKGGWSAHSSSRVNYEGWKARRVWRDKTSCRARLTSLGGSFRRSTLKDPVISEGNHRRDAAVELGHSHVPVEIRYFGHAEQTHKGWDA
jgi:hypothetical protein